MDEKYIINPPRKVNGRRDYVSIMRSKLSEFDKKKILSYMKAFNEPCGCCPGYIYDPVQKKELDELENQFTDGKYIWYSSWLYYFEKYDLRLNPDFIQHVFEQTR